MLCNVCKDGLEGMWDPSRTKRLALLKDFKDNEGGDNNSKALGLLDAGIEHSKSHGIDEYVYGHHQDKNSFRASVRDGCAMCNRFRSPGLRRENLKLQSLGYYSVFHVEIRKEGDVDTPLMFVEVGISSGGFDFVPFGDPKFDHNINFNFGRSNHDPMVWSIMDNWMKTCFKSHAQCKLPEISPSYRPTRLIKINSQRTVRLVQGAECPPVTRYVALSYCWGNKPVKSLLRLLQSTLEELSREQPVDNLPKTFRDAIEVAQHFGVDYIWIDRLCIFQDSPEDWQREASTMQDMYRNALFSIAATGARDDEGGCFFERDPTKVAPTIVRIKLTEDGEEKAFRFGLEKAWSWRLSFRNEPLVQRSWVVQERLLAPRTLHFGSKQVFWECREASCCEMHPQGVFIFESVFNGDEGIEEADPCPKHPFLWKQLLDAPDRRDASNPYEQLFSDWKSITNYYVDRKLTVASDKLVALSGLANDMKARLEQLRPGPHRYLAGHWEETLMDTIMWSAGSGEARRALQYRAPSWSWACMDGGLGLMGGCRQGNGVSFASMVSVKMTHLGSEDTGEVVGGILTLAGPCAVVKIDVERFQPSGYPRYKTEKFVQRIKDDEGKSLYERNETGIKISFDTLEDFVEEALLMWMCSHMYYGGNWYGHGLALSRVEGDRFRRVGLVHSKFNTEDDVRKFSIGFSHKQVEII